MPLINYHDIFMTVVVHIYTVVDICMIV